MDAAETLSKEGISVEVIDLRTLHPLDMQTVSESVSRTGRAMVVTEDCLTAGVSAELSARIMEEAFDFLEEPVVRLSGEDIPIPVSPQLEQGSVPGVERIMSTVKMLLRR
jgi:pyruvate dehydrogenase E1 component beta subunit